MVDSTVTVWHDRNRPDLRGRAAKRAGFGKVGSIPDIIPSVYCHPALATEAEIRIRGAAMWCGGGVVTGSAAARLSFWPELPVTNVSLACPTKRKAPPGVVLRRESLPPNLIMEYHGVRMTVPALTALDLGASGIDQALLRRAATLDQLHEALATIPNRFGNTARRFVLYDSRDEPWSDAERRLHRLMRSAKITGWRTNVEVWCGSRRYFVDAAFYRLKIGIEVDGYEVHSQRAQFEHDRQKWSDLTAAGWTLVHFTWHQLTEQPDWVIATIHSVLRQKRG